MTGTPSISVKIRNALEALVQPEMQAAINFAEQVKNDSETALSGNLSNAFENAGAAFLETGGTVELRVFAAVAALAQTLLGYEVSIIKADAKVAVDSANG